MSKFAFNFKHLPVRPFQFLAAIALSAALAWGCGGPTTTVKEEKPKPSPVFWPAAPDPPRVQFLKGFTHSGDLGEGAKAEKDFLELLTGKKRKEERLGIIKPYGIAIHDGVIYAVDITLHAIVTFDLKARKISYLKLTERDAKLKRPASIFIEPDGTKYIADIGRKQIVVLNADNRYRMALGGAGNGKLTDVAVSGDRVYAPDMDNHQILIFDKKSGDLVHKFGKQGKKNGEFNRPIHVAVDHEGNVYVVDLTSFRIQKFDPTGKFLVAFGQAGRGAGTFSRPKGVAVDREGNIFSVDAAFEVVQIFNNKGRPLMFFGKSNGGPGQLVLPVKVVIDYDNVKYFKQYIYPDFDVKYLALVTSQFGKELINVYGFGQLKKGAKMPPAPVTKTPPKGPPRKESGKK